MINGISVSMIIVIFFMYVFSVCFYAHCASWVDALTGSKNDEEYVGILNAYQTDNKYVIGLTHENMLRLLSMNSIGTLTIFAMLFIGSIHNFFDDIIVISAITIASVLLLDMIMVLALWIVCYNFSEGIKVLKEKNNNSMNNVTMSRRHRISDNVLAPTWSVRTFRTAKENVFRISMIYVVKAVIDLIVLFTLSV